MYNKGLFEILYKRIKDKTEYTPTCWLWKGVINRDGHGQFVYNYKTYIVSRISATINLGLNYDNKKELALHKQECPNKHCWNPEHLYVGNQKQNVKDSIEQGTRSTHGWSIVHERRSKPDVAR